MFQPGDTNPKVPCARHRRLDMRAVADHLVSEL